MAQIDRVAAALAGKGIPLVALKNSGIARALHTDPAANPMGDVDLLVRPGDFRRAHDVITGLGFELASRSPLGDDDFESAENSGGVEYTTRLTDGSTMWLELQWRPVAGRWIREDQEPPADELIGRSRTIPGSDARLLAPEDNLLQVCLHTAKHSYVRAPGFRLHTDVDRIVRSTAIDWSRFAAEAERLRTRTAVFFSLALAATLLRTPVPHETLMRLRPSTLKTWAIHRLLTRAGLFDPDGPKWSRVMFIVFTALLYDSPAGVLRSAFPPAEWMAKRYHAPRDWRLGFYYLRRLLDLTFNRTST
jgi:hypothetical protein